MNNTKGIKILLITCLVFLFQIGFSQNSKFKVVIDAGHGGKDPGTSSYGVKEKDVALAVTLKVGKTLGEYSDIEVVYTRKKDVFLELNERTKIANDADSDLFVSIHCNGVANTKPYGTETFVMGLSRSAANLEISKKENSVIYLEDNYEEKYKGFDPKNPESLIGMRILQEEYLSQSIDLAAKIENKFSKKLNRNSRGVKQTPLYVLDYSYMPSVLVELGFLSNKNESNYLKSEKGQNELSQAIADAILDYKKEFFQGNTTNSEIADTPKPETKTEVETKKTTNNVVYKVQISASSKKLETKSYNFNGLNAISREKDGKLYKYFYAEESSYDTCQKRLKEAKSKGYKSAFIVAYKDGVKINVADALK